MDFKISCLSVSNFLCYEALSLYGLQIVVILSWMLSLIHNSLIFVSVLWWIFNIRNRFYNYLWYILIRDMFFSDSLYYLLRIRSFLQEIRFPSLLYWSEYLRSHWTHPAFPRLLFHPFHVTSIYYELNECLCFR